jgi:hypothetical protein
MSAIAGLRTRLLQGLTPTTTSTQATTSLGSNRYRITNSAWRIIDPQTPVIVLDGGVPIAASGILDIDYLGGIIELASAPSGAVTVTLSRIPVADIADAYSVTVNDETELYLSTVFATSNVTTLHQQRISGLSTASLDISVLQLLADEPGGDDDFVLREVLHEGKSILVEMRLGTVPVIRGWFLIESASLSSPIDGRVEGTLTLQSQNIPTLNPPYEASYIYTF